MSVPTMTSNPIGSSSTWLDDDTKREQHADDGGGTDATRNLQSRSKSCKSTRQRRRRKKKKTLILPLFITVVIFLITGITQLRHYYNNHQRHGGQQMLRGGMNNSTRGTDSTSIFIRITTETLPSYNVVTFYYPWYRTKDHDGKYRHWNHKLLPHWTDEVNREYGITDDGPIHDPEHNSIYDIGSTYFPALGPYSSLNDTVIQIHMDSIRTAGIGVVVISWYPPGTADNGQPKDEQLDFDKLVPKYLHYAKHFGLKVALHVEPYSGRTASNAIDHIIDACIRHGKDPAYYKIEGRPVFYIYDSYRIDVKDWKDSIGKHQESNYNNSLINPFLYMLWVERSHLSYLTDGKFDGAYTYFASDGMVWGSNTNNWKSMAKTCQKLNKRFSPSVGPGYNDLAVRPWNGVATKRRELTNTNSDSHNIQRRNNHMRQNDVDNKYTYYYERMLHRAMDCFVGNDYEINGSTNNVEISITSWNEWHEGTQIEPAVSNGVTRTAGVRRDRQYLKKEDIYYPSYDDGNPNMYVDMTKNILQNWKYH